MEREDISGRLASLLFEQVCKSVELEECSASASTAGPSTPVQEEGNEKKRKKGLLSFLSRQKKEADSSGGKEPQGSDSAAAGNVLVSPFSVGTALSLALLGARGETAAQLRALLSSSSSSSSSEDEHAITLHVARQWGALSNTVLLFLFNRPPPKVKNRC
jgi:hypothetical protein